MEKLIKNLILNISIISLVLVLAGPITASAASTPSLGTAATYGVLTGTFNYNVGLTTITGVVGQPALGVTAAFPGGGASLSITGTTETATSAYTQAGSDQGVALTNLSSQLCGNGGSIPGYTFAIGAIDLATDTTHGGTTGHYSPGVYCVTGAMSIGTAGIVLDTPGTYIFRSTGAFDTANTSTAVTLGTNVSACDVFWIPGAATTIHANNTFIGTVIDNSGITISNNVLWTGRALAYGAALANITADTDTITVPTCTVPVAGTCGTAAKSYLYTDVAFSGTMCALGNGITTPASPTFPSAGNSVTWTCGGSNGGASSSTCTASVASTPAATLTLVKTIVGGTRGFADFPLTATGPTTVTGVYGTAAVLSQPVTAGTYTLSEATQSDYTAGTWSCINNANPAVVGSSITLAPNDVAICTIQNTYITPAAPAQTGGGGSYGIATPVAPLIDVVKVPSPLALPAGPGLVTYTYTVSNIGVVPMTKVTVVDDSCSPLVMTSGDSTANAVLQVNGKWTYTCATTLSATHTNTVTAIGWANGVSSTDIATATVVVGTSTVPPLIHVTKVPNPLTLPIGGGFVTYTKKVTNPGTVPLSNVTLIDDKCGPVTYISGDTNGDSKLDPSETWTYTCSANLTKTTTNTVVATGQANGLTARDFAIATVVVATPALPNTGFAPEGKINSLGIIMLGIALMLILTSVFAILKKRAI